jgi:hypothetical protein
VSWFFCGSCKKAPYCDACKSCALDYLAAEILVDLEKIPDRLANATTDEPFTLALMAAGWSFGAIRAFGMAYVFHSRRPNRVSPSLQAFWEWLGLQATRQDPVGDLARDWTSDMRDGCVAEHRVNSLSSMDRHLREVHDSSDRVLDARDRAWREFMGPVQGNSPPAKGKAR